ncbi:hypothetical protein [Bacillus sp. MCCB 382]
MNLSEKEKEIVVEALQFYINNTDNLPYEDLRDYSDLKERIKKII